MVSCPIPVYELRGKMGEKRPSTNRASAFDQSGVYLLDKAAFRSTKEPGIYDKPRFGLLDVTDLDSRAGRGESKGCVVGEYVGAAFEEGVGGLAVDGA